MGLTVRKIEQRLLRLRDYYGTETGNEYGPMMQTAARELLCSQLDDTLALCRRPGPAVELPERFPPMQRSRGPVWSRGCVMTALMDIDNQLHSGRIKGEIDWPIHPLSRALRVLVANLEAEEEGKAVTWEDDTGTVARALKTALVARTPVAYFAYGAINHSGGFHSRGKDEHGYPLPNRPGWYYFQAEHTEWAGPYESESEAREASGAVGDE